MEFGEIRRRLLKGRLGMLGLVIVAVLVAVAVAGPWLAPYDPIHGIDLAHRLEAPSVQHWFGTDEVGRDVFSRVVSGARISLTMGVMVVGLAFPIGTLLGVFAAFLGGRVENAVMRLTDIFLALPNLVLAMAIAAALGPSLRNVLLSLVVVWWPWYTRIVRSMALQVREMEFVQAARALGMKDVAIILRHVLPNSLAPALVTATLDMGFVVLTAAGLSFIGLGAQPPTPEWGAMLSESRAVLRDAWWAATFPGLAIVFTVLGFNLLGDAFRDAVDPRLRGQG